MCAEFALGGKILAVCSIHLEDKAGGIAGRWSQFRAAVRALDVIQETPGTSVIAGDFNTFDCRVARWLSGQGADIALGKPNAAPEAAWWKSALLPRAGYFDPFPADLWTFSVQPFFRAKLDWITVRSGTVESCGVGSFSSSDHRPIWADLTVGAGKDPFAGFALGSGQRS